MPLTNMYLTTATTNATAQQQQLELCYELPITKAFVPVQL